MTSHGRKYHTVREVQSAGLLRGPSLDLSQTRAKILDPVHVLAKKRERRVSRSVGRRRERQFDDRFSTNISLGKLESRTGKLIIHFETTKKRKVD